MRWQVRGRNQQSGKEVVTQIEAGTKEIAAQIAADSQITVSQIIPAPRNAAVDYAKPASTASGVDSSRALQGIGMLVGVVGIGLAAAIYKRNDGILHDTFFTPAAAVGLIGMLVFGVGRWMSSKE